MPINRDLISTETFEEQEEIEFSFDAIQNGYNETLASSLGRTYEYHDANVYKEFAEAKDDYQDNLEEYTSFIDLDIREKQIIKNLISKGLYSLEDGELVTHNGSFTVPFILDEKAIKGALRLSNIPQSELDAKYQQRVHDEIQGYSKKNYSMGGQVGRAIGAMGAWAWEDDESIIELFTPTRILGASPIQNMLKAFGVEFTAAGVAESIKQFKPYGVQDHRRRAMLDDSLSQAVEDIFINAGLAGVFRSVGSGVVDANIMRKIKNKTGKADYELFARWNRRETSRLIDNKMLHQEALERVAKNIDDGKPVDIKTDVDINDKTSPDIEAVNINDEQTKFYQENGYDKSEQQLFDEIDEATNTKIEDTDPFVEEQLSKLDEFADDIELAELKAQLDELDAPTHTETSMTAKFSDNIAAGTIAGVEQDEEGNITFSPEKFVVGLGGYTAVKQLYKRGYFDDAPEMVNSWAKKYFRVDVEPKAIDGDMPKVPQRKEGENLIAYSKRKKEFFNKYPELKPEIKKQKTIEKPSKENVLEKFRNFALSEEIKRTTIDKPFNKPKIKVYRGESENSGTGLAMFGSGLYSTTNKKLAEKYGKVREVGNEELPSIPLQFETELDFKQFEYLLAKDLGIDKRDISEYIGETDEYVQELGYDGITYGKGKDQVFVTFYPKETK